ncbi:elongation factor G [Halodesulfovibrio marinisediminis]|uniref:Elongation factor G n=1 Tax=Halodesulfovibrio marinisediminis DSM 17456 TaxID=1121457 RepID=A0A1N6DY93_9BACT|nr:elongation factor G [Halodesulfovibrio marinisediminis]SIN75684.1 translation elongation factor 2 (EF-2/EF-G) [Halodesulfovibrio marinisediminis DSM 17456]
MSKGATSYLNSLRNIGIIAHIDAGKTTLTERILYYTDKIYRMGEVHEGTATMDFMPEEQERGITIASACTSCEWDDGVINIIDTPGHVDFTIEVERSLRVLDGAVGVFCAVGGVEPQSETVWRQSEKFNVPKIALINKMDRLGADFKAVLKSMRERLNATPVMLVVPLGEGDEFYALADVLTLERLDFDQESEGREYTRTPLAGDELAFAEEWREKVLEIVADRDDEIMELYLAGEEIPIDQIKECIRKATLDLSITPVFCGSALKNVGVQCVLDGVFDYLPNPLNVPAPNVIRKNTSEAEELVVSPESPLGALAFKVYMDDGRKMVLARVYSGTLRSGDSVQNITQGKKEKPARLYRLHASHREQVDEARAGEIVALAGMKFAKTGDSLATEANPYLLENITGYRPVISRALEPANSEEADKLDEVLEKLLLEDPTLQYEQNPETGQRVISGMGELHLEVVVDRLRREYHVAPRVGNPQVVYQETITGIGSAFEEFDRELGDKRHYGYASLTVSPRERDSGNVVRFGFDTSQWPEAWLEAVEQGVKDGLQCGVIKGYPVQDVEVVITDIKRNEHSSEPGYRMAAGMALKAALGSAAPELLEPIMDVEISVPDENVGDAISLLGAKGAKVENLFDRAGLKMVQALAPMCSLFGFSTDLRSATQGRAGLVIQFLRFDTLS